MVKETRLVLLVPLGYMAVDAFETRQRSDKACQVSSHARTGSRVQLAAVTLLVV